MSGDGAGGVTFLLLSRRRVLECASTEWKDEEDVLEQATLNPDGVPGDHLRTALPDLEARGFIERDRHRLRLTDSGLMQAASQGPFYSELRDA